MSSMTITWKFQGVNVFISLVLNQFSRSLCKFKGVNVFIFLKIHEFSGVRSKTIILWFEVYPQISGFSWNFQGLNVVIGTSFRRYECRFSANQPFKFHWKCYLWQKHENFKGWTSSFHSFWINFHDLHEHFKVWSSSSFWKFMNFAR